MSMFDEEYFIVCRPRQDDKRHDLLPYLSPDDDTVDLRYRTEILPVGHKPLVFFNAAKDLRARRGKTTVRTPPPILFDGDDLVVEGRIRERLLGLDIPNVALQPAIYIDDWGKWHEDYWFVTFEQEFSGWDRKRSELGEKVDVMGQDIYTIYRVSLDDQVMKSIPLRDRLLLQLDTMPGLVLAHMSIAPIFAGNGNSGALVVWLADYPNRA